MRRWLPPLLALALAACSQPSTPAATSAALPPPTPTPAPSIQAAATGPVLAKGGTTVVRADGSRFLLYARPGPGARRVGSLAATNDWRQPLWLPALSGFVDQDGTIWF